MSLYQGTVQGLYRLTGLAHSCRTMVHLAVSRSGDGSRFVPSIASFSTSQGSLLSKGCGKG
jgi:hypothetical protein